MNATTIGQAVHFSWIDHSMFVLMLVVSTVVGVLIGVCGKQDTKVDYLLGGKKMSVLPVSISLIFSHISGITMVALPTEYYTYGAVYFNQYISGLITCTLTFYLILPVFFELQLTSIYEYFQLRFDKRVRKMASFFFVLNVILYLPIVIYVPALSFSQVTGINIHVICSGVCGVCMLYTMMGGMKAVVWTDFLQSFVTVSSSMAIVILGLIKVGGFSVMLERSEEGGRLEFLDMNPDPFERVTFVSVVLGHVFIWLNAISVNQGMLQKFIALPSLRNARISLVIFYIGFLFIKGMTFLTGLLIYTNYYQCDPIASKQISKADQILPFFTMDIASRIPGLPGLFIAGIFSASLSTLSSNFNCLSATIFEDFVSPFVKKNKFFQSKTPLVLKGIVIIAGIVSILMVFVVEKMGGIIKVASSASGITSGTLLGMFLLGMLCPWAHAKGCLAGGMVSLLIMTWLVTGAQVYETMGVGRFTYLPMSTEGCQEQFNITVPPIPSPTPLPAGMGDDAFWLYKISFQYYCLVGSMIVLVVGPIVSYFTGFQDPKSVDARLLVPFMKKYGNSRESDAVHPLEKEALNMKTSSISNGEKNDSSL